MNQISCVGSFGFHNQKDDAQDAQAIESRYHQVIGQANKGKGKRNGGNCLLENHPTRSTC